MSETIRVVVADGSTEKGLFGGGQEIPVDKLKSGIEDLVRKLAKVTSSVAAEASTLKLREMEVGIEITAEGGISLIGVAKAGATASLKLTFAF